MKKVCLVLVLCILIVLLIYISNITNIPENLILFQGETLNLKTALGVNIETESSNNPNIEKIENKKTVTVSSDVAESDSLGNVSLEVSLFGIKIKQIDAQIIENTEVVPLGNLIGMKLYTNGVLVVGMSDIVGKDGERYKPYEGSGIQEGDVIIGINEKEIASTYDLTNAINSSKGESMMVDYVRDKQSYETKMQAIKTEDNVYKIGLWVRDTAAGVGTATFYDPNSKMFGSLGHGIIDNDTEKLIDISSGEIVTAEIVSISKGTEGNPGKIQGSIDEGVTIGTITKNTNFGVFGSLDNLENMNINEYKTVPVALRNEVTLGPAKLICSLDDGQIKEYDVNIEKIYLNNNIDNKSMVVKITDEELLKRTGGIIQGMSGSPIIQNGKLVASLTHVMVNNFELRLCGFCRNDD